MTTDQQQDSSSSGVDGQHASKNPVWKVWNIVAAITRLAHRKYRNQFELKAKRLNRLIKAYFTSKKPCP